MTFARLPDTGTLKAGLALLLSGLLALGGSLGASAAAPLYAAVYAPVNLPTAVGAGTVQTVAVSLTNLGTATWNAAGANPVDLSYHWYDASGAIAVWEGQRTGLGSDVAPNGQKVVTATVTAPASPGVYQLRFALVKEGVQWFDQETAPHIITLTPAYAATFGQVTPPSLIAGRLYTVSVPVTNAGTSAWTASGANPVDLSYHWLDAQGNAVVWDGARTGIGTDLAAGQSRTLNAMVIAPNDGGAYTLAFDLVREGVAWFNTPTRVSVVVAAATYRATYTVGALSSAYIGEAKTIPLTVTNLGNVPWPASGPNLVDASYHWIGANGAIVVWDGPRTALPADVQPGTSAPLQLAVTMPTAIGSYTLQIELVREGFAWFSSLGSTPANIAFQVTSGYNAGYGADTTPASITPGAGIPISIDLTNYGQRTWSAGGPTPVHISYHVYDSNGGLVIWDGDRGTLPVDVSAGATVNVSFVATAPRSTGNYTVVLDLVQEGVGWFSSWGVSGKTKPLTVFPGVTIYGKGWGHGVGLSQWGAQGWASGAAGTPLTGEQIVMKYFPGAQIAPLTSTQNIRVLLSAPSTGCIGQTVYNLAQLRSDGGLNVLDEAANRASILTAAPTQTVRVWVSGTTLYVMDEWSGQTIWTGTTPIVLTQRDATKPTTVVQKSRWYRGDLRFEVIGFNAMRVVNWVNADDYTRGSVPVEMLVGWNLEAYKAQAYAARTYASWKQATMKAAGYDLRDDTSDQCYGGASVERDVTSAAAAATAGRILTYAGQPIRAYYASSDGGAVDGNGCVWNIVGGPYGGYNCGSSEPYLTAVADPADLAAVGPSGPNPHRAWTVTFQSWQIENAVAAAGYYIGSFVAFDLSDRGPGGHVVAVRVVGTGGSVWLPADSFLRTRLGLKSTMVRLAPF